MIDFPLSESFSKITVQGFLELDTIQKETLLQKHFFPDQFIGPSELAKTYQIISSSEFSSCYIIEAKDQPVFLIEIHLAEKRDVSLYYDVLPNDYCLTIFISQSVKQDPDLQLSTLLACKKALFAHDDVSRLIAPAYIANCPELLEPLLVKAGFIFIPKRDIAHPDLFISSK